MNEPKNAVAWRWRFKDSESWILHSARPKQIPQIIIEDLVPHKPWQTITEDEVREMIADAYSNDDIILDFGWLLHLFEQTLKERNHG